MGNPIGRSGSEICSDCGISLCADHAEACELLPQGLLRVLYVLPSTGSAHEEELPRDNADSREAISLKAAE
jgi:hypothetical protein